MSSSDSDEENVIRYGTPLEPYDEDEVPSKRKFQQPADQYAVDAHGRRRFHGAFTGGFSAGHGNTVGTPEGWAPTAFKSSRNEKATVSSQRPEDFMDDEDRGEFGIAPRLVQTQGDFSGQKRPRQRQFHDGPIPGEPVLQQLIQPVHETAAVRMLRAMGWRPGQGAGERLNRGARREARERRRVYGCYMPEDVRKNDPEPESSDSDSEIDYETLFAPEDYEPYVLARKNDRFGLGYSGLSRRSVLGNLVGEYGESLSTSHLVMKEKGKRVSIRGQAFGVGAFEADDDDVYATEDMSHYDFTLGGETEKKKRTPTPKDGQVLEGFVRASNPQPPIPSHPPPALPRDYTPLVAGQRRSRFEPSTVAERDQGLGRHELTPTARGELLGETPLPTPTSTPTQLPTPISITVDPSSKDDPIAKLLGRNVNFVTTAKEASSEMDFIPIKDSGKEIPKTFKPFISNPAKQTRYERYLSDKEGFALERDSNMDRLSEWERNRELVEFEQAAKLYRPLTGEMGDRFTHASQPDDAINPLSAVAKSSSNYGLASKEQIEAAQKGVYGVMTRREVAWRPEGLVCKRFNVPEPGVRSESKKEEKPKVSYSIFSYLENSVHDKESFAREQTKFSGSKSLPDSLKSAANNTSTNKPSTNVLVPESRTSGDSSAQNDTNMIPSTSKTNPSEEVINTSRERISSQSISQTGVQKRLTVAELFLKESEKDLKEKTIQVTETIEKFDKMDLYKSIFLSDSENEDETPKVEEKKNKIIDFDDLLDVPKNTERNTSPPRGIFANIDFDELNSWKRNTEDKKNEKKTEGNDNIPNRNEEAGQQTNDIVSNAKVQDTEMYGPKIPYSLQRKIENPLENFRPVFQRKDTKEKEIVEVSSSNSDSWVDVKEVSKKKKKKKHKSKHKKKHKKKDR